MAVRNYTLSGITEDGVTQSIVPGYEGLDFFCIKERVVVGTAAVQFTLNQKFPKRAKCMGYAIKCQAAATVTTATHIGIGFGSDVDGISETAIASINVSIIGMAAVIPVVVTTFPSATMRRSAT